MSIAFSLAPLTALNLTPPDFVTAAAEAGYQHVGVRLAPASPGSLYYPLWQDPSMLRETRRRLADTGVEVFDLELVRLGPDSRPADALPMLECGAGLGGRSVLVAGDDPDLARFTERFAELCELGAPLGLAMDLEFMPWTRVPDLATAIGIVRRASRPNGGVLIDTFHFDRSSSQLAELDSIPREWLHYVQVCDAPAEQPPTTEALIHQARAERMFPGDGGIDIAAIVRRMPRDIPVSVEIPTATLARTVGPTERARRARVAAETMLAPLYA